MDSNNAIILLRGGREAECSSEINDVVRNLTYLLGKKRKNGPQKMEEIEKRLKKKEWSWILIDPYLEVSEIPKDQYGGLRVLDEFLNEGTSSDKNKPNFIVLSLDSSETFFDRRFIGKILFRKYSSLNEAENVFYLRMPFEINTLQLILNRCEAYSSSWACYFRKSRFESLFSSNLPFTIALLDDQPEEVEDALCEALESIDVRLIWDENELSSDASYQALLKVFDKGQCEEFLKEKQIKKLQDHDIDLYLVDLFFEEESQAYKAEHPPQDIPVSDSSMKGLRLIERIRRLREDAKIVALTRFKQQDKIIHSIRRGANWFFHKEPKNGDLSLDGLINVICSLYDNEMVDKARVEALELDKDDNKDDRIVDETGWILDLKEKEGDTAYEAKKQILESLFLEEFNRITIIDRAKGGLSGGDTLFVRPEKKKDGSPDPQTVKVVKIGERFELFYEKRNYEEIIDRCLDSFIGRVKGDMAEKGDFAGVMYTSVGTSENYKEPSSYPKPLKDYIERKVQKKGAEEELEKSVEELLFTLLKPLHGTPRKEKIHKPDPQDKEHANKKTISDFYWEILPAWWRVQSKDFNLKPDQFVRLLNDPRCRKDKRLILRPQDLLAVNAGDKFTLYEVNKGKQELKLCLASSRGKKKIDVFKDRTAKPKITEFLTQLLETQVFVPPLPKFGDLEKIEPPLKHFINILDKYNDEIHVSRIHGDFNLGNILYTLDKENKVDNYWLIDFSKTKQEGHTAFDFTKLELEIRTQILANVLGGSVQDRLMEKPQGETELYTEVLKDVYDAEIGEKPIEKPESARRLYGLISKIRRIAIHEWGLSPKEYFLSLYLYSLSALKFKNLRNKNINRYAPLPAAIAYVTAAACAHRLKESFRI